MATYSLSGTGTQTLTTGTGALYVSITTLPTGSGDGGANPTDYNGIGFVRPGNATAFWEPFPIIGGPQWLPLPAGTTRIGYVLFNSAVASAVEVAGSSPLAFPLASLPDVAIASVADAQVLAYQASTSKWINATPTGGGGGGTTLTTQSIILAADVSITATQTFVTALSLTLAAGTWYLHGQMQLINSAASATDYIARINVTTTIYSAAEGPIGASGSNQFVNLGALVVLGATTTVTLQAAMWNSSNAKVAAQGGLLGQGAKYTQFIGLKTA